MCPRMNMLPLLFSAPFLGDGSEGFDDLLLGPAVIFQIISVGAELVPRIVAIPLPHRRFAFPGPGQAGEFVQLARDAERVRYAALVVDLEEPDLWSFVRALLEIALQFIGPVINCVGSDE